MKTGRLTSHAQVIPDKKGQNPLQNKSEKELVQELYESFQEYIHCQKTRALKQSAIESLKKTVTRIRDAGHDPVKLLWDHANVKPLTPTLVEIIAAKITPHYST